MNLAGRDHPPVARCDFLDPGEIGPDDKSADPPLLMTTIRNSMPARQP
ncbi:hypothetical protein IWQ49_002777 [Labrenzia sp. EL_126]|nr:hypothetical protein [Labrenzia sp. EL_126]